MEDVEAQPIGQDQQWPVYVLSTTEAVERQDTMRAWVSSVPCLRDAAFFVSERDRANTRRGCFKAHQAWARNMVEANHEWGIVFEDDVETSLTPEQVEQLIKDVKGFLDSCICPPDIVFLGHMPLGRMVPVADTRFAWSNHSTLTHAMVVSKVAAEQLLAWDADSSGHVDQMIAFSSLKQAAVYPQVMFQKDLPSFHTRWQERMLLKLRTIVGARRVVRITEWVAIHLPMMMIKKRVTKKSE